MTDLLLIQLLIRLLIVILSWQVEEVPDAAADGAVRGHHRQLDAAAVHAALPLPQAVHLPDHLQRPPLPGAVRRLLQEQLPAIARHPRADHPDDDVRRRRRRRRRESQIHITTSF